MFITSRASANMAPPWVVAMVGCGCDACDGIGLVRLALAWLLIQVLPGRLTFGSEYLSIRQFFALQHNGKTSPTQVIVGPLKLFHHTPDVDPRGTPSSGNANSREGTG